MKVRPEHTAYAEGEEVEATAKKGCFTQERCAPLCLFALILLVLVPAVIFALSAFFALLLYEVECEVEVKGLSEEEAAEYEPEQLELICTYYEWFKYVCGNLVGVGLSDVEPLSGHLFGEILDLLISTWSLVVTGSVVGLVGALTVFDNFTQKVNDGLDASATITLMKKNQDKRRKEMIKAVEAGQEDGVDCAKFIELMRRNGCNLTDAELEAKFHKADDGDGKLTQEEAQRLMDDVDKEETHGAAAAEGGEAFTLLVASMGEIKAAIGDLKSEVARIAEQQATMLQRMDKGIAT